MSGLLLALWSVPRSRSTAFLRMMTERGDMTVEHEPFSRVTDFGQVTVAGRSCATPTEVKEALIAASNEGPVFFKDTMDFRYPEVLDDAAFLRQVTHTFMIRSPKAVVASHLRVDPDAACESMGFGYLCELLETVIERTGQGPFLLDGDDLVADAEHVVKAYCDFVGIDYDDRALAWSNGTLPAWDRTTRWHSGLAHTTGFTQTAPAPPLASELQCIADGYVTRHLPCYDHVRSHTHVARPPARSR